MAKHDQLRAAEKGAVDRRSLLLASGGLTVAASAVGYAPSVSAQAVSPDNRNFAGSRLSTKYRFDDPDMDLFFLIALGWGDAGGLSVGEAFYVASTIKDGDADSWVASFAASGDRQQEQAEEWKRAGLKLQSGQARLKAFISYRSAWQFAPIGPVFNGLYAKHRAAYRTAIADLGFPATFFEVPYRGKSLPGMFIQNANRDAPVVLLLGGADTCFEEILLTVGRNLFDSGNSVAMADLPGQGITMKDGFTWEREPEKPIAAIIDLIIERFGARPGRMALLGYSLGGYWATRAAGHERRFATVIASTPFPRPGRFALAAAAARKKMAAEGLRPSTATQRNNEVIYWKAGVTDENQLIEKFSQYVADPALVTVPFLSVVGAGEGAEFQRQSKQWNDEIRSSRKKLVVVDAWTGGDGHCQAGDRLRLAQEMISWMTPIFYG